MEWAKTVIDNGTTEAYWNCQKGVAYWISGYTQEPLANLQRAKDEFPESAVFLSVLAELYIGVEDYNKSLECLHMMRDLHSGHTREDDRYRTWYWQKGLVSEGLCHRRLDEFDAAAVCLERYVEHGTTEDWHNETHGYAVGALLESLHAGQSYDRIIDLILKWGNGTEKGMRYWILELAARLHIEHFTSRAAKRTGRWKEVCDVFRTVIEDPHYKTVFHTQATPEEARLVDWVQYTYAVLTLDLSDASDDHWEAVKRLEALIELSTSHPAAYYPGTYSVERLSSTLLTKASTAIPGSEEYLRAARKLEALAYSSGRVIRDAHTSFRDPRLLLTRLRTLEGRPEEARAILYGRLRWIFDGWTDALNENEVREKLAALAITLNVLGHDSDAQVAYQGMKPMRHDKHGVNQIGDTGADAVSAEPPGNLPSPPIPSGDSTASATADATVSKPDTYGWFYCDGPCESVLRFHMFACRTCLNMHFCPDCYRRLQNGELSAHLCRKEHLFLAVGPAEESALQRLAPGEILVHGQAMTQKAWLDRVREEWSLRQDQIDAYKADQERKLGAAKVIALAIVRYNRRKRTSSGASGNTNGADVVTKR